MKGKFANKLAKCKSFNEFYTLPESCEEIFRPLRPFFMDKKIHCPCDDENSAIVQWLQQNTNSTITFSHLPEHDMNGEYARQKMLEADLVVTNPPFSSCWNELFKWLTKNKIEYFIFGPTLKGDDLVHLVNNIYKCPTHKSLNWDYTVGSSLKSAATVFYTSLPVFKNDYEYKAPKKEITYFEGIPVYDRTENVPKDYFDWMYVPVTFIYFVDLSDFDVGGLARPPTKYIRFKVRRKRGET